MFNQNAPENCLRSTKIATTVCKISKIPGKHAPGPPIGLFIFNMLQNNSARRITLEIYVEFGYPLPEKISDYAADIKTFSKGLFTHFLGLTSLYSVNIQPNSKFHPLPTKVFWIHS